MQAKESEIADLRERLNPIHHLNMKNPAEYRRLRGRLNYLLNPEPYRQTMRAYRSRNRDRLRYENAIRAKPAPTPITEEQRLARNEAQKRHAAKNPQRRIRQNIDRALLLMYGKFKRGMEPCRTCAKTEAIWGCTWQDFRAHIARQLEAYGWTWADYCDKWTMDHVAPVRKFVLPNEKYACWHYTNLRPLPKEKNHARFHGLEEMIREEIHGCSLPPAVVESFEPKAAMFRIKKRKNVSAIPKGKRRARSRRGFPIPPL